MDGLRHTAGMSYPGQFAPIPAPRRKVTKTMVLGIASASAVVIGGIGTIVGAAVASSPPSVPPPAVVASASPSTLAPRPTPTTETPSPVPTAATTTEAPPPPPPTTEAPPPPPPPTTDSYQHGVHPGAFCSPAGALGYTSGGQLMRCGPSATDSHNRWRAA